MYVFVQMFLSTSTHGNSIVHILVKRRHGLMFVLLCHQGLGDEIQENINIKVLIIDIRFMSKFIGMIDMI